MIMIMVMDSVSGSVLLNQVLFCFWPHTDSFYDTFHTTADIVYFCQMMAVLEVINPLLGLVKTGVFPAMIQVISVEAFPPISVVIFFIFFNYTTEKSCTCAPHLKCQLMCIHMQTCNRLSC